MSTDTTQTSIQTELLKTPDYQEKTIGLQTSLKYMLDLLSDRVRFETIDSIDFSHSDLLKTLRQYPEEAFAFFQNNIDHPLFRLVLTEFLRFPPVNDLSNDSSEPISIDAEEQVATLFMELIKMYINEGDMLVLILSQFSKQYLLTVDFQTLTNQNERLQLWRELQDSISSTENATILNQQLERVLQLRFPEDYKILFSERISGENTLTESLEVLKDNNSSSKDKAQILIEKVIPLLEEEKSKKRPDEKLIRETYGVILVSFDRAIFADPSIYGIQGYGTILLGLVMKARKEAIQNPKSVEGLIFGNSTPNWLATEGKVISVLSLLASPRHSSTGIEAFYTFLLDNSELLIYMGDGVMSKICEQIYFKLPSQIALRLFNKILESDQDNELGKALSDISPVLNAKTITDNKENLNKFVLGRFIVYIASRPLNLLTVLLETVAEMQEDATSKNLAQLILLAVPELQEKSNDELLKEREAKSKEIAIELTQIKDLINFRPEKEEVKEQELQKLKDNRTVGEIIIQKAESVLSSLPVSVFKSRRYTRAWETSIKNDLERNTDQAILLERKDRAEEALNRILILSRENDLPQGFSNELFVFLTSMDNRMIFVEILRELANIFDQQSHPLHRALLSKRDQFLGVLESIYLDQRLIPLMPSDIVILALQVPNNRLARSIRFLDNSQENPESTDRTNLIGRYMEQRRVNKYKKEQSAFSGALLLESFQDIERIITNELLFREYSKFEAFNSLLKRFIETCFARGLNSMPQSEIIFKLVSPPIWENLSEQNRLLIAREFIDDMFVSPGSIDYIKVKFGLRAQSGFRETSFTKYLSGLYKILYIDQNFKNKVEAIVEEQTFRVRITLTKAAKEKKARSEYVSGFTSLHEYFLSIEGPNDFLIKLSMRSISSKQKVLAERSVNLMRIAKSLEIKLLIDSNVRPLPGNIRSSQGSLDQALGVVRSLVQPPLEIEGLEFVNQAEILDLVNRLTRLYYFLTLAKANKADLNVVSSVLESLVAKIFTSNNDYLKDQVILNLKENRDKYGNALAALIPQTQDPIRVFTTKIAEKIDSIELKKLQATFVDLVDRFNHNFKTGAKPIKVVASLTDLADSINHLYDEEVDALIHESMDKNSIDGKKLTIENLELLIQNLLILMLYIGSRKELMEIVFNLYSRLIAGLKRIQTSAVELKKLKEQGENNITTFRKTTLSGKPRERVVVGNKMQNDLINQMLALNVA